LVENHKNNISLKFALAELVTWFGDVAVDFILAVLHRVDENETVVINECLKNRSYVLSEKKMHASRKCR
jgi:hypothetical protein